MMEEVLAGIAEDIDVPPVNPGWPSKHQDPSDRREEGGWSIRRLREELESLVLTLHSTESPSR